MTAISDGEAGSSVRTKLNAALAVTDAVTTLGTTTPGTGVTTALGVNVGSAGAFVTNGGALGTPSAGVLTNTTGLPVATGISGLGTGVATALAINVGSAGAPVVLNGALGTPSAGVLTNATGLVATTGLTATGTKNSTTFLRGDNTWAAPTGGSGDVVGPASATDNAIARYDATTGKLIQNSGAIVNDAGAVLATDIDSSTPSFGNITSTWAGICFYSSGGRLAIRADGQAAMFFGAFTNICANDRPLGFETGASGAADTLLTRPALGVLKVTDGSTGFSATATTPVAIASLMAAATAGNGARAFVTDALSPVSGATVAAGGAVSTPVYSDGTNWKVG